MFAISLHKHKIIIKKREFVNCISITKINFSLLYFPFEMGRHLFSLIDWLLTVMSSILVCFSSSILLNNFSMKEQNLCLFCKAAVMLHNLSCSFIQFNLIWLIFEKYHTELQDKKVRDKLTFNILPNFLSMNECKNMLHLCQFM